MKDREFSALLAPVVVVLLTIGLIVGIGEFLLALADMQEEIGGVKEPFAVVGALALALTILVGATLMARSGRKT